MDLDLREKSEMMATLPMEMGVRPPVTQLKPTTIVLEEVPPPQMCAPSVLQLVAQQLYPTHVLRCVETASKLVLSNEMMVILLVGMDAAVTERSLKQTTFETEATR